MANPDTTNSEKIVFSPGGELKLDNNFTPEEKEALGKATLDSIKEASQKIKIGDKKLSEIFDEIDNGSFNLNAIKIQDIKKEYVALLQVYGKQKGWYKGEIDGDRDNPNFITALVMQINKNKSNHSQGGEHGAPTAPVPSHKQTAPTTPEHAPTQETGENPGNNLLNELKSALRSGNAVPQDLEQKLSHYDWKKLSDISKFPNAKIGYGKSDNAGNFEGMVLYSEKTLNYGKFKEEDGKMRFKEGTSTSPKGEILEGKFKVSEGEMILITDGTKKTLDNTVYTYKDEHLVRMKLKDGRVMEGTFEYKNGARRLKDGKLVLPDGKKITYKNGEEAISTPATPTTPVPSHTPTPENTPTQTPVPRTVPAQTQTPRNAPAQTPHHTHAPHQNPHGVEGGFTKSFIEKNKGTFTAYSNILKQHNSPLYILLTAVQKRGHANDVKQLQGHLGMSPKEQDGRFGTKSLSALKGYIDRMYGQQQSPQSAPNSPDINNEIPSQSEPAKIEQVGGIDPKVMKHIHKACERAYSPLAYMIHEVENNDHPGKVADAIEIILDKLGIPERSMSMIHGAKKEDYQQRIKEYFGLKN